MRASLARPRFPQAALPRPAGTWSDGRWRASVRSFCGFCVTSRCNFCRADLPVEQWREKAIGGSTPRCKQRKGDPVELDSAMKRIDHAGGTAGGQDGDLRWGGGGRGDECRHLARHGSGLRPAAGLRRMARSSFYAMTSQVGDRWRLAQPTWRHRRSSGLACQRHARRMLIFAPSRAAVAADDSCPARARPPGSSPPQCVASTASPPADAVLGGALVTARICRTTSPTRSHPAFVAEPQTNGVEPIGCDAHCGDRPSTSSNSTMPSGSKRTAT